MARFLLLETLHHDPHRHHGAEFFPFLLTLGRELGWEGRWWTVPVPDSHMHVGARFVVDLPPDSAARVAEALVAWPPDVVLLPYRPTETLRAVLADALPDARIADLTMRFPSFVGRRGCLGTDTPQRSVVEALFGAFGAPPHPKERLLADVAPAFGRRWLGDEPPPESFRNVRVAVEAGCGYQQMLREAAPYAEVDDPELASWRGCAFCHKRRRRGEESPRFATPAVDRALAQIVAHQRDEPPPENARCQYVFDYGPLNARFEAVLEGALAASLAPSTFVTMMRADALVARRASWEALLPRLRDAGHRLGLISIGAENFSPAENERFNKGVTAAQLWSCVDLLQDYERRFPGVVESQDIGYFSAILFTPWTTPADLAENVAAGRRLGAVWFNRVLGTRLQLWAGTPIAALAERDGLTASAWFADAPRIVATSAAGPDDEEIPWRFADAGTARLHRLLIRLTPISRKVSVDADDPLVARLAELRKTLPAALAKDYVALVGALVEAVAALGAEAPVEALFAHAAAHAELVPSSAPPREKDPKRFACLVFTVGPPGGAASRYEFRVFSAAADRPHFRREGKLAMSHGDHPIDRPAEIFVSVLRRAMQQLPHATPGEDPSLPQWREAVTAILARANLATQFAWDVEVGRG